MSHDRGCPCGREKWDYRTCPKGADCIKWDVVASWDEKEEKMVGAANERQMGGDHYRSDYQHWDLVLNSRMGYLEGCATKYVARHRKKNGVDDLRKALHYVDKLMEAIPQGGAHHLDSADFSLEEIAKFCTTNALDGWETAVIVLIGTHTSWGDLASARKVLSQMVHEYDEIYGD